jgi:putative DNA primase/helicase
VSIDIFDTHPNYLNLLNCTVDLKTLETHDHRREDFLTKLIKIKYDPDAKCPRWLQFLREVTSGTDEMIDFLQMAIGYTLTGDVSAEAFFYLSGYGSNGKSTFQNILMKLLGEYATTISVDSLLVQHGPARMATDVASMRGQRLVTTSEPPKGKALDIAKLKQWTGTETVHAEAKFQDPINFAPTWKIWFSANHDPEINDSSHAAWRRVFKIVFPNQFAVDGGATEAALTRELEGILAWAIQGAKRWYDTRQLPRPAEVEAATKEYRAEQDEFGQYMEDHFVKDDPFGGDPPTRLRTAEVLVDYNRWAKTNKFRPLTAKAFAKLMKEHGYPPREGNQWNYFEGFRLKYTDQSSWAED